MPTAYVARTTYTRWWVFSALCSWIENRARLPHGHLSPSETTLNGHTTRDLRLFSMRVFAIMLPVTIVLAAAAVSGTACAGDTKMYKTVDAQGNVVYSDEASSPNKQPVTVRYHEPSAEDLKGLEQQRKAQQAAEVQRLQQAVANDAARKQQQAQQTRCENARRYYNSIKDAGRLYRQDDQGNPVFLSDQEADAKRAQASQSASDACGS
jgi:hypothetical protein